ncbi:hypothetical protein NA56DRAFT_711300 [Hyaloscypha hepaticicola]|uniref:Uncharacterized protein n=1 Tax=Hyaloscypha hepaticicola TaxID=2082293 RepID=A0A2J6PJL3_9HELO|nr:hypothetical protein NA56DRAFT_711300 [Hyaloscypha hepaticicola]
MFFFLSLRESSRGTVEPSMLPTTSTSSYLSCSTSSFREYITKWDFSDGPSLIRRLACVLAFILHIPLNIISILSWGISFFLFLGIIMSLLNLALKRRNFDYVILALVAIYGGAFTLLLLARLHSSMWAYFLRAVWPCLIAADIFCFIAGWVATWRDVSLG